MPRPASILVGEGGAGIGTAVGIGAGGVCVGGGVRGGIEEAGIGGAEVDGIGSMAVSGEFVVIPREGCCRLSVGNKSSLGLVCSDFVSFCASGVIIWSSSAMGMSSRNGLAGHDSAAVLVVATALFGICRAGC